ncbi:tRNA(fMet)-specific endonuclease VapC [compost metagenome]
MSRLTLSRQPVFVDTSVLVSAEDTSDPAQPAVLAWLDSLWRERLGRVSSQTLAEFYEIVTVQRPRPMPQGDARAAMRRYQTWTPWQIDAATFETAWAVEARHQLAWGDCLALAAAQHSGCETLLSLQLPHGAQFGGVHIIHPVQQGLEP